ncbi:DNA-processing protein DprA [Micromonospora sp. DT48]|uniref:DNA-processing protein DprA n=1 Tax=unclassified Micromonospora TaxID=2617518 RepID=UPI0012BC55CE|nr:DNA-processing protein DprA [Micromonospora sp. CP22]MTK05378.1 DNA processing protein DprA [Micromonospora sp. CP22]
MPAITDPTIARAVLAHLTTPGNRHIHALVQNEGPPTVLCRLLTRDLPAAAMPAPVGHLRTVDEGQLAEVIVADTARLGARIVTPNDAEWPTVLRDLVPARHTADGVDLPAPPLCLWVRADRPLPDLLHRAVAVVGSRACTSYGQHVATELGHGLAEQGWIVLNVGGYGIDAAALRGALTSRPDAAVAMPACGLDRLHPAGNRPLFDRLDLISVWSPSSDPSRIRTLLNQTWLAALTCGAVLVEAAPGRGRGILARALALGRPAMAVPGPVTSRLSAGCHQALREEPRIRLVCDATDVVAHLTNRTSRAGQRRDLATTWEPGWVALPGVGGPYPALVADLLSPQGWPIARFGTDAIVRIAADCDALAARVGESAGTTRIRLVDGTVHVSERAGTSTESTSTIAADADGYYLLDGWSWQVTDPPLA